MARATAAKENGASTDAVQLLKQDHRSVEQLLDQFEKADDEEMETLAQRICMMLTVHAQIEEEILYPAAQEALEEEDLVQEAKVEHTSVKELIAKIEAMSSEDELFKATVTVLGEYVRHHVKEEEGELFPLLRKAKVDLKELGAQLAERKMALLKELGMSEEEVEAASSPPRGQRRASSKSARAGSRSRSSTSKSSGRARAH